MTNTSFQPHVGCEYFQNYCQFEPYCYCVRDEVNKYATACTGDMRLCPYFPDIREQGHKEEEKFVSDRAVNDGTYISRSALISDLFTRAETRHETIPAWIYEVICKESGGTRC